MPEYKLLVLGTAGVGKSCLSVQFVNGMFVDIYNPTVEDSFRKQVTVDDEYCVLNILDTAGVEDFSAVRQHYTLSGDGFLIVYSITSSSSFLEVDTLYQDILRIKDAEKVPAVVVANKMDLEAYRQVPRAQGEAYCAKQGVPFFEVSAKNNINVEAAFYTVVREVIKQHKAKAGSKNDSTSTPPRSRKRQCVVM